MPAFSLGRRCFSPLTLLFFLGTVPSPLLGQEAAAAVRERVLQAEDRRARAPGDSEYLRHVARGGLPAERSLAIRALGRLEDRGLVTPLARLLSDPQAAVRAEAAQALAQALQAFRRDTIAAETDGAWSRALEAMGRRAAEETDPAAAGMLALSLGRVPYRVDDERLEGERRIRILLERIAGHAEGATLAVRGAETIRRLRTGGSGVDGTLTMLLRGVVENEAAPDRRVARRRALGALLLTGPVSADLLQRAFSSPDPELRRLAVSGIDDAERGHPILEAARSDRSVIVRREAARVLGRRPGPAACRALADLQQDPDEGTRITALDGMGVACPRDAQAFGLLRGLAEATSLPAGWRPPAHALVALARIDPQGVAGPLAKAAGSRVWQVRMYAARAAQHARDTALLIRLSGDPHPNVREAAVAGLRAVAPREAEAAALRALRARDYQLVLTAAEALQGTERRQEAGRALLEALTRISADGAETSRDTRVALLARLREVGAPALAPRLRPRLADFDPVVAESAAALLAAWTGRPVRSAPQPRIPTAIPPSEIAALQGATMRLVMAGGDTIEAGLLTETAPLTVARIARLARRGYYDGLTFHRVVPNFVIQGGSPGANEYAGDGPYMRDELSAYSHERGSFGISTRGRDTGDAQLFVNLVDNPRLDYDYTVWARVVRGLEALDRIGEGDVIRRLEIRGR